MVERKLKQNRKAKSMITPKEKLSLIRLFERSPKDALLVLIEALRKEIEVDREKIKREVRDSIKDGDDGQDADPQEVARELMDIPEFIALTKGEDGKSIELRDLIARLKSDTDFIAATKGENGKAISVQDVVNSLKKNRSFLRSVKGEPGHSPKKGIDYSDGKPGKDGSPDTATQIATKLNTLKQVIEPEVIIGLLDKLSRIETEIAAVRRNKKKGGKETMDHGGGDTVRAGTNITITRNADGTTTISSTASGGSSIATEALTGTQAGTSVTLDLTQLSHTYTGILLIMRNGQILTPTTSWSRVGDVITILNASASNTFLVQYTY
jgi:hypothetical protein